MSGSSVTALQFSRSRIAVYPTILLCCLLLLSWIATFSGLYDYIKAYNEIALPLLVALGLSIAMLQLMIYFALSVLFSEKSVGVKFFFFGLYLFLTGMSLAFGFGFFWKIFASHSDTTESAQTAITRVQSDLGLANERFRGLQATLDQLAQTSENKYETEKKYGGTCAGASGPGPRARARLRQSDFEQFSSARDYLSAPIKSISDDIEKIDVKFRMITQNDNSIIDPSSGTRIPYIQVLNQDLKRAISRANNISSDPQLEQIKKRFLDRASQKTFPDERNGTFYCPDSTIETLISLAVASIDKLPKFESITIPINEGSFAVAEAINRLGNTAYGLLWEHKLPLSASEFNDRQQGAKALDENIIGLGRHDVVPLGLAFFVDFCILGVAIWKGREERLIDNDDFLDLIRKAYRGTFGADAATESELISPLRAVVFSHWGTNYGAVPLDFRDDGRGDADVARASGEHIQSSGSGSNLDASSVYLQTQYIGMAFEAFHAARFVRVVGMWRRLINGLSDKKIQKKLTRQHSLFSEAPTYELFIFRRDAWNDAIVRIMRASGTDDGKLGTRPSAIQRWKGRRSWAVPYRSSKESGLKAQASPVARTDEFPQGIDLERD